MSGKTFSQLYDIRVSYKQGPWSDSNVHGSEVWGLHRPVEDNPQKEMLAKCPMFISKSGQEQHTEVADESQKQSKTHMYHAILYHLVSKNHKGSV
jgi:hypothetical protein